MCTFALGTEPCSVNKLEHLVASLQFTVNGVPRGASNIRHDGPLFRQHSGDNQDCHKAMDLQPPPLQSKIQQATPQAPTKAPHRSKNPTGGKGCVQLGTDQLTN